MSHRLRRIVYGLFQFCVIILLLGYGLPYGMRKYFESKRSPAANALLSMLMTRPVHIRPEWIAPQPAPADLMAMIEREQDDWTAAAPTAALMEPLTAVGAFDALITRPTLDADLWSTSVLAASLTSATLAARQPLLDHPAYDLDFFLDQGLQPPLGSRERRYSHEWSVFVRTSAAIAIHEGRWDEASSHTADLYRRARRHPGSKVVSHLVGFALMDYASNLTVALAEKSSGTAAMRTLAAVMDANAPRLDMDNLDTTDSRSLDHIALLRGYGRAGLSVDLQSTQTHPQLVEQSIHKAAEMRAQLLRTLPPHDARLGLLWTGFDPSLVNGRIVRGRPFVLSPMGMGFRHMILEEYVLQLIHNNFEECRRREQASNARFRMARQMLAARIYELEQGRAPATPQDLVPDYLPVLPVDPFSGQPFLQSAEGKLYSVGYDGIDDKGAKRANPDNMGNRLAGDIIAGPALDEAVTTAP